MAAIILPEKWHTQPSFPVEADRSHPLLRGAIDYVLAGPTGMSGFYSKDTSQLGSTLVGPGSTVDGVGRFTDASNSSQYEEIPTVITDVASNYDAFTLYCCGVIPPSGKGGGGSNFGTARTVYGLRYDTSPFGVAIGVDASTPGVIAHPQMSAARSISLGNAVAGRHFDAFCWYDTASNTWKGQIDNLAAVENASTTTLLSSAAVSPANRTGYTGSGSTPGSKTFLVGGAWWRVLDDGEKQALRENPWQMFVKDRPRIYSFSTGGGGVTGTLSSTESGSDTAAFAGDVYVSGSLAATETGNDTASVAGDVFVSGILAATESGSDTAAIAGDVYVSGTMGAIETGSDTASIAGDVIVQGTLAATESGSDTAFFNGSSTVITSGTLAAVESGSDTASVTGKVVVAGALASSESGQDTASITGDVFVSGALAATESGQDTSSISGNVLVEGAFAATETGSDTAAFIGTGASIRTGTLAAAESGQDSASMAGRVLVLGELAAFEVDLDQAHFTNSAEIFGVLSATESGQDKAAFRPKEFVTPGWTIYGLPRSWRIAS